MLARHMVKQIGTWQQTKVSPGLRARSAASCIAERDRIPRTASSAADSLETQHGGKKGSGPVTKARKACNRSLAERHEKDRIGLQFIAPLDMDAADASVSDEAKAACGSPDAEAAATRIVSNLPASALRESSALRANQCDSDDQSGSWGDDVDEDDDEDEDIDIDELAEDMAVLEEELEQGAWDPIPPAGFPDYIHGVSPICLAL